MKHKDPETVGRYQVLERVGRGGMGVLYRGVDPVLDREVAIKLMLADFSDDSEQMRPRFYREARSAAKLQHRNIVTIFEFAEEGTTPYIVMEFLRGTSLATRMETAPPLTLDDKLDIVAQLCSGLSYAHEQGVVHRDVKPANVFLLEDGTVKLLDFGIAKVTTSNLTKQGDVLGSASYMSPEQVMGSESVDGRADIFSTGVMLYELLAGRKPFEGEAATAIVMKILNEDPPPIETVVSGLPPQLVAVVKKALQRDPVNRYATAADFGRELQVIRKGLQSGAITASIEQTQVASTQFLKNLHQGIDQSRGAAAGRVPDTLVAAAPVAGRKWIVPAGIGVAAVAIIAVAGFTLGRTGAKTPAESGAVVPPRATQPAGSGAATNSPAVAPVAAAVEGPAVLVNSDPPGAAIFLDGTNTHRVTPASIAVTGAGPHRLRLSKQAFQAVDARLGDADLKTGSVSYQLKAAEVATIPVSITGPYAFEVFDGQRSISPASETHELAVPAGKTLRLVAGDYMLNQTVSIDGTPGKRLELQAPALGRLTVLAKNETCSVKIGNRDLGFPPINNKPIASGSYRVDSVCPNGQNPVPYSVVVPAGGVGTAKIF